MTKSDRKAVVGDVLRMLEAAGLKPADVSKPAVSRSDRLAAKDEAITRGFARKGIKVTLMDRADPSKEFDVRPFKGWYERGRVVRKGERGVRGLFHVSQTQPLEESAAA